MRYSFDLVERPWLPCVMLDGQSVELGLSEALARAREIREIRDASPLVTVAVHRLLLAILHRCFGPATMDDWLAIWRNGSGMWDVGTLNDYFSRWRERFDLFHHERPFYQHVGLHTNRVSPVSRLYHELASGNNPTLFDHSLDEVPPRIDAGEAARILVAHQAFAVGGGRSSTGYTLHSPLIGGVVVLFRGDTLFETLMLNLIRYAPEQDEPLPVSSGRPDLPVWERDVGIVPGGKRSVSGYLDLLTWQSRAIRLIPEGNPPRPFVSFLHYAQGEGCAEELVFDPQMPMVKDRDGADVRLRLSPERALWRDSTALVNRTSDVSRPAVASNWLAQLMEYHQAVDDTKECRLSVYGLATDRAKILLWREEDLPLPLRYLEDPELTNTLARELQRAEGGARALDEALYALAVHLLQPDDDIRARGVDQKKVRVLMAEFPAAQLYWSRMELHFHDLIRGLISNVDEASRSWLRAVRREAARALETITRGLGASARALKASLRARAALNGGLFRHVGKEEV